MSTPNPSGSFVPIRGVGDHLSTGGRHFDFTRFDQGRIVKRIGVHYNPSTCLRGLSISYENGDTRTTGALQKSYNEITLEPGETIRRASLWGNGRGTRTGRIWFETDRGRTCNAGRTTTGQDEFPVNVGSGILAGFVGRSDADILILGFVFPSEGRRSPTSISVSAGFPGIISVESGFSWGVGTTQTWMRTETTKTSSWSLGGTLEPGEEVTSTTTCQYGSADLEYTADVKHVFNDGQELSYVDRGTLGNAEYGFAEVASRTGRSGHMVLELQERARMRPLWSPLETRKSSRACDQLCHQIDVRYDVYDMSLETVIR